MTGCPDCAAWHDPFGDCVLRCGRPHPAASDPDWRADPWHRDGGRHDYEVTPRGGLWE
ncbi:MAG TPA: hypothetical protein VGE74_28820 [Gemmata sp.]